ncbi:DUF6443 domain-containing protein [Bacteroides salyersiae]|nr:DUF6443 domain-containing protein [Bacteroides salyersiae]
MDWKPVLSQDDTQNYIRTRVMLDENASKYTETVQYYDGLGRPYLNVQKNITPSGANLSTLREYDALGRESKTWLPYVNSPGLSVSGRYKKEDFHHLWRRSESLQ